MTSPLFYRTVAPLDRERHRKLKLDSRAGGYAFAAGTHVIPALAAEITPAAPHLPVVFLMSATLPTPVFLVGLRPEHNDFVNDRGEWTAGYLPAFMRRYPFIIGEREGLEPALCIDTAFDAFSPDHGEALFDQQGAESVFLLEKLRFSRDYYQAAKTTETFAATLRELELLRPITIEKKDGETTSTVVHGLFCVDENKLATLSDETFLMLRHDGWLGPIHAHLISLAAVSKLGVAPTRTIGTPAKPTHRGSAKAARPAMAKQV